MMSRRKGASATRRATKHNEDLIEDGNHNGPSSDAEHAREETGQPAGGPQYHRQKNQLAHDSVSASLNIAVSTGGTRVRRNARARLDGVDHLRHSNCGGANSRPIEV